MPGRQTGRGRLSSSASLSDVSDHTSSIIPSGSPVVLHRLLARHTPDRAAGGATPRGPVDTADRAPVSNPMSSSWIPPRTTDPANASGPTMVHRFYLAL